MPLVPINAVDGRLEGVPRLIAALEALPEHGRVTVMIHGYTRPVGPDAAPTNIFFH